MGKIRNSIVAIICVLVFSLTACGSDAASSADSSGKVQKTQNTDNSVNADQEKEDKLRKHRRGFQMIFSLQERAKRPGRSLPIRWKLWRKMEPFTMQRNQSLVRTALVARIHREHQVHQIAAEIREHQEMVLHNLPRERLRLISVSIPQRRMAQYPIRQL